MTTSTVVAVPVEEPVVPVAPEVAQAVPGEVVEDLLVEDVSIDGMCGVY